MWRLCSLQTHWAYGRNRPIADTIPINSVAALSLSLVGQIFAGRMTFSHNDLMRNLRTA